MDTRNLDPIQKQHMQLKLQAATLSAKATPLVGMAGVLQEYLTLTGNLLRHSEEVMKLKHEQPGAEGVKLDAQPVQGEAPPQPEPDSGNPAGGAGAGGQA